jgi:hypothetical protein
MAYQPRYLRCPICRRPVDDCWSPIGAHLLCTPNAECRRELCLLLAGDVYDHSARNTEANVRKAAS